MTYQAKVIAGGKIVIPAELRRDIGIKDGDSLLIERDDAGSMVIKTYDQVVREARAAFKAMVGDHEGSAVDELFAERRAEAEREEADIQAWRRDHGIK
jgi:AbrB family looped-hinge helix DNA binding protein